MHFGAVPMENIQENFTTWICTIANPAMAPHYPEFYLCLFMITDTDICLYFSKFLSPNKSPEFIEIPLRPNVSLKARVTLTLKTLQ